MKMLVFLFALLVTAAVLAECLRARDAQVGEMQRESKSIQAQDAKSVRSKLQMGAGELNITGGADQLMEGEFSYNVSDWKPKVSYDVSGERGELVVKQGSGGGSASAAEARNEWDISLNDEVPTDLVVQMGAGESDLDLDSLTLTGLNLQMGAGKTTVDLTGDYAQGLRRQHTGRGRRGNCATAQRGWG